MTPEGPMPQLQDLAEAAGRETAPIIAVDIGNARIKFGRFDPDAEPPPAPDPLAACGRGSPRPSHGTSAAGGLPSPSGTLVLDGARPPLEELADWLAPAAQPGASWWIGSVNRRATTALLDWLRAARPHDPVTLLSSADLPLVVRLPEPDKVGVDRLLDAVAANALRPSGCPAVVVDVGTAITVDLVAPDGAFCGGAILPGIAMSARALHEFTDLLPRVDAAELREPPPAVGTSTVDALRSGLFWFAVGAIREVIARMTAEQKAGGPPQWPPPHVLLTGGAGEAVAALLGPRARLVPHLTLAGIALTARTRSPGA